MNQYPGEAFTKAHSPEAVVFVPRAFHVDNFRLQLREGKEEHTVTRIKRTKVHWDRGLRRFSWKRFGLIKALIDVEGKDDGWRQISWPKEANRDKQSRQ